MKEEDTYEEEEPAEGPTMEELRLPDTLEPVWYNMTLKLYLPGYVMLPEEKNFTTDGNILIGLAVKQPTSEIVLNAKDLKFPADVKKVKLLTERTFTVRVFSQLISRMHFLRRSWNGYKELGTSSALPPFPYFREEENKSAEDRL
ncbi:hypothetical protein COOONC_09097 [Cooperia oncophora]